jgi:hypothetical protein
MAAKTALTAVFSEQRDCAKQSQSFAIVVQGLEHFIGNEEVGGSIPSEQRDAPKANPSLLLS